MNLLDKLKNYTLEDAIKIEAKDRQFLALKKLYENKNFSDNLYLFLIITNALISFQLSGKGEDYWEELSLKLIVNSEKRIIERKIGGKIQMKTNERGMSDDSFGRLSDGKIYHQKSYSNHLNSLIYTFFEDLLKHGKNNRRFVNMKLKRVKRFLDNFKFFENDNIITDNLQKIPDNILKLKAAGLELGNNKGGKLSVMDKDFCDSTIKLNKMEFYYKNMNLLTEDLAKIMNQSKEAKTIVFAVKMFSYGARNVFGYLEYFPFDLMIPIDSRLENLYKKHVGNGTKKEMKQFYLDLAKKLNIPPLHLDAILWVNYEKFVK